MITVKRNNHPAREIRSRHTGEVIRTIPEHYECGYFYEGREIARYWSQDDCLCLRTEYIGCDFKRSAYDRAVSSEKYGEAYQYLFAMLNVDRTSNISEYCFA